MFFFQEVVKVGAKFVICLNLEIQTSLKMVIHSDLFPVVLGTAIEKNKILCK